MFRIEISENSLRTFDVERPRMENYLVAAGVPVSEVENLSDTELARVFEDILAAGSAPSAVQDMKEHYGSGYHSEHRYRVVDAG